VAEAKGLAIELRAEVGVDAFGPFDPYALAELYGIAVIPLSVVETSAKDRFLVSRPEVFSGALIRVGNACVILENDAHTVERRRATLSHELAHVMLEHEFPLALTTGDSCTGEGDQEHEADRLGGELLIPYASAFRFARRNAPDVVVAAEMGVSVAYARWRMNASGARTVAQRTRTKYARRFN
jgi:Zn-dependent peptidase ImmA (M78 family)